MNALIRCSKVLAVLAGIAALVVAPPAWAVSGAGFTTFDATQGGCNDSPNGIDCNNYSSKADVYMSGGPTAAGLSNGCYYFAVLVPGFQNGGFVDGATGNLSDSPSCGDLSGGGDCIAQRTFHVSNHLIDEYATSTTCGTTGTHGTGTSPNGKFIIQLIPYDDTSNPGGVYDLAICQVGATKPSQCKYDNFRVPPSVSNNCTNEAGSTCCTLTQGCLGAFNSVCTCTTNGCNPATGGKGYLFAAPGNSCLPATVGTGGNSVTIDNLCALVVELPAQNGPAALNQTAEFKCSVDSKNNVTALTPGTVQTDRFFSKTDKNLGGTGGQGGGTLTGYALACGIAECLGNAAAFSFPSTGLGGFTLPTTGNLLCTKRVGEDKQFGTSDDVCEAFAFPTCVSGKTVGDVQFCVNEQLGMGSNDCGCSVSDLGNAMSPINRMFDNCGQVVTCPGSVSAGTFDCSLL